ncbi:MAG: hypothetical protein Q7U47_08425 [Paludibacter sp.]|nr:hypothetical protein [Paludibacter sp.]
MKVKKKTNIDFKTVLVIVVGFTLMFIIFDWKWALWVGWLLGLFSLPSVKFTRIVEFLWMKLAFVLSKIIPNLLLSVLYYFFLTPLALLSRALSKRDHLNLKNNQLSLFKNVDKVIQKTDFEKTW